MKPLTTLQQRTSTRRRSSDHCLLAGVGRAGSKTITDLRADLGRAFWPWLLCWVPVALVGVSTLFQIAIGMYS
jgi:hypothetical protein